MAKPPIQVAALLAGLETAGSGGLGFSETHCRRDS
jgi:hypothetical protein